MKDFFTALALAITFEGMLYALFPAQMKRSLASLLAQPDQVLRWIGLAAAVIGVGLVALLRRSIFA